MKVSAFLSPLTLFAVLLWAGPLYPFSPISLQAATIPVDTTNPGVIIDSACSLAEALIAANTNTAANGCPAGTNSPTDIIVLGEDAIYHLTSSHGNSGNKGPTGLPTITSNIIISGNNGVIERSGADEFRLFHVAASGNLTLQGLTLRNGPAITDGVTLLGGQGGAILNEGMLIVVNSYIISSTSYEFGGGLYNSGTALLTGTHILSSTAGVSNPENQFIRGGGLFNMGTLVMTGTHIIHNSPDGIANIGMANFTDTYINANLGNGISNTGGTLHLSNTRIGSNFGTGVNNVSGATVFLTNTHVTANSSPGIFNFDNSAARLSNSHIRANLDGGILNVARSSITLHNSTIVSNYVFYRGGGGVYNENLSKFVAIDSLIASNIADSPGGGIFNLEGEVRLTNSTIASNTTYSIGGGILNAHGTVLLVNSRVLSNSASLKDGQGAGSGAGIFNYGTLEITDSDLIGNHAAIQGSALFQAYTGSFRIERSRILYNTAPFGSGAVYHLYEDSSGSITQSCVVGNSSTAVNNLGGPEIDASHNWWGTPDGPSGVGPGFGDSVSTGVNFAPYLVAGPQGCPTRPAASKVYLPSIEDTATARLAAPEHQN